jgi:hypothetical protein
VGYAHTTRYAHFLLSHWGYSTLLGYHAGARRGVTQEHGTREHRDMFMG